MASASLWLYRVLLRLLLPVAGAVLWLGSLMSGKRRPPARLRLAPPVTSGPLGGVWVQAVSVGEVEVARRLLAELQRRAPHLPVLVTSTTATGLELARRTLGDEVQVTPCPLDVPRALNRILEAAAPRLLVLVETELWPEMIHQAARRGVRVVVVNGRLSEGSLARYLKVRPLLAPLLAPLDLVLVRDEVDGDRFASLGVPRERIQAVGNIKYDIRLGDEPLPWEEAVRAAAGGRPIVVAGSTMEGEEEVLLRSMAALRARGQDVYLILAPRHPERFERVAQAVAARGLEMSRRSRPEGWGVPVSVFLLDTIGELARAYRLARVAFVGGSLVPTGGHNPLEPATWGVPVLSGREVANFREVFELMVQAGGARLVADGDQLTEAFGLWLRDEERATAAGRAAREVVEANRGATRRTVDAVLGMIHDASDGEPAGAVD